jgi:hypothetical protein
MIDYQGIRKKVKKLETDANDIQNMMEELFDTLKIKNNDGFFEEWEPPNHGMQILHQNLILIYESWYNQSHMLIQNFYPKKELEFRQLHDNIEKDDERPQFKGHKIITYGLSDIIRLKTYVLPGETKERFIKDTVGAFRKQLAILIALPEVLHLCGMEKVVGEAEQSSKKTASSFPSQTININASSQITDNSIHIQNFSYAADFIDAYITDPELKQDLLKEVKDFEMIKKSEDYMLKYQHFVEMLANHVTAFQPILGFLLQHVPK